MFFISVIDNKFWILQKKICLNLARCIEILILIFQGGPRVKLLFAKFSLLE